MSTPKKPEPLKRPGINPGKDYQEYVEEKERLESVNNYLKNRKKKREY